VRMAFFQVKALPWVRPGSGIPSISTGYAHARCCCPQVIHMFVHRQAGRGPVAVPADSSDQRAGACGHGQHAGREDPAWARMGSVNKAGTGAGKKTSCRGRIRQGPPMYEMEGPCPASPAPRAARRCQVPVRRAGFPAPPTFPGWPPGRCPFPTVKAFLLPPPAQAQGVVAN